MSWSAIFVGHGQLLLIVINGLRATAQIPDEIAKKVCACFSRPSMRYRRCASLL
jgi:hypothetical protein